MIARETTTLMITLALIGLHGEARAAPSVGQRQDQQVRRGSRARAWIARTRAARTLRAVQARVRRRSRAVRGRLSLAADRLQRRSPPRLSRQIKRARRLSPSVLGGFVWSKARQDPVFYLGYGGASAWLGNMMVPALLRIGLNPLATLGLRVLCGRPLGFCVLLLREHHKLKRRDPGHRLGQTLEQIGREYAAFQRDLRAELQGQARPRLEAGP